MFGKDKRDCRPKESMMIMGKPLEYWIDLQSQVEALDLCSQMERNAAQKQEIYTLRAKVSYYESKVQDMATFMKINLEVK
jgi:hypothetical protein